MARNDSPRQRRCRDRPKPKALLEQQLANHKLTIGHLPEHLRLAFALEIQKLEAVIAELAEDQEETS